jgi:hypothetical protein
MAPPPMTARAKAKAKKEAAALLAQQQAKNYTHLTAEKAAILVDKNSRTIVKLSQLLEIYNKPGASDLDTRGVVAKRIEQYKRRISRRLVKLAKVLVTIVLTVVYIYILCTSHEMKLVQIISNATN